MEKFRGDRAQRPVGPRSPGCFDTTESIGVGVDGYAQGETGDKVVQDLSEPKKETLLGKPLLVKRIFCEHGWH